MERPFAFGKAFLVRGMKRSATISPDGVYRWDLIREWNDAGPRVLWCMLNPSVADAHVNDTTTRRCMQMSEGWGYGGLTFVNLFALRAQDPSRLLDHPNPVGALCDGYIAQHAAIHDKVIVGWGSYGQYFPERVTTVVSLLQQFYGQLWCIGLTTGGQPRHPRFSMGALSEWIPLSRSSVG
jgi:hypothetical protein